MQNMVALFLFLKGMTGALAPFSYLVIKQSVMKQKIHHKYSFALKVKLFEMMNKQVVGIVVG